ncbi:MAG: type II toxin-antitoxin system death-on-curing family toxin [Saprospiraceae bacterium]
MIEIEQVIEIHNQIIEKYGGARGIRDERYLESAIARPFMGSGDFDYYPTPVHKAAALLESLVHNHPFMDGNKRTGYIVMRSLLNEFSLDIQETMEARFDFLHEVAEGKLGFEEIYEWLSARLVPFK